MKFFALFSAVLATTALARPSVKSVEKRSATSIVNAIAKIGNDLTTLNSTVLGYDGGLLGTVTALDIEIETTKIESDLREAIEAVHQSAPLNSTESFGVGIAVLYLEPKIQSTLQTIVSKKSDFQTGLLGFFSLDFLVEYNLEQQQKLSTEFGAALLQKLDPAFDAIANNVNAQIAGYFQAAIDAFSN